MPTPLSLSDGQDFTLLDFTTDWYIKTGTFSPGTSFTQNGSPMPPPTIHNVESDGAQVISIDTTIVAVDNFSNQFTRGVGDRPRSRVRR